jgi:hypothetical protein
MFVLLKDILFQEEWLLMLQDMTLKHNLLITYIEALEKTTRSLNMYGLQDRETKMK